MTTLTVTCPVDRERFVVIEPEGASRSDSLTVTCPSCNERFAVVYPEEVHLVNASQTRDAPPDVVSDMPEADYEDSHRYRELHGELQNWHAKTAQIPDPYTGSDQDVPVEQYVEAEIREIGGKYWLNPEEQIGAFEPDRFRIWYTPEHDGDPDSIAYVVRANLETGVKTKNVYKNDQGELYVKNRGVPRDSDKQWTFLDREECTERAHQAGLDGRIEEDSATSNTNRYRIYLTEEVQPLATADSGLEADNHGVVLNGNLSEDLVLELARVLVAFQTKRTR